MFKFPKNVDVTELVEAHRQVTALESDCASVDDRLSRVAARLAELGAERSALQAQLLPLYNEPSPNRVDEILGAIARSTSPRDIAKRVEQNGVLEHSIAQLDRDIELLNTEKDALSSTIANLRDQIEEATSMLRERLFEALKKSAEDYIDRLAAEILTPMRAIWATSASRTHQANVMFRKLGDFNLDRFDGARRVSVWPPAQSPVNSVSLYAEIMQALERKASA